MHAAREGNSQGRDGHRHSAHRRTVARGVGRHTRCPDCKTPQNVACCWGCLVQETPQRLHSPLAYVDGEWSRIRRGGFFAFLDGTLLPADQRRQDGGPVEKVEENRIEFRGDISTFCAGSMANAVTSRSQRRGWRCRAQWCEP